MRTIGLTGSIACGKSNVSAALRDLGAAVVDGDLLSRELTAPGGKALPAIRQAFGGGVFHGDGTLNRRALGDMVFASVEARARLDGLMQPLLRSLILRRMEEARAGGAKICVLDMPLLYEAGLDALCDTVWCVHLPRDEQIRRLMARDGLTREQVIHRMESQMSDEDRARRAARVIRNDQTVEKFQSELGSLYQQLLKTAREREN